MSAAPRLSIILATYNRREVVRQTLGRIEDCGLGRGDYEVIVVDNASTDGTAEALAGREGIAVRRLDRNLGSCAKAVGVEGARGGVVVFLDDDSYPRPGCVQRMLEHFAADARLGAAGFTVHLANGSQECSALPHAFVGCGVGLRARALREVGGLDASFFMQAEEYDLSWRLLQTGWAVEVFGDLQVEHAKSPVARRSERATYYDVCNNLRIIARYLPGPFAEVYRQDWLQRYGWIAEQAGHVTALERGLEAGEEYARSERRAYRHWRLSADVLEQIFSWGMIEHRMAELQARGLRRIVLADLGKNVYAYWRGARSAGLDMLAIADDRFSAPGRVYREVAVCTMREALALGAEAYVVSNTSYVHAQERWLTLAGRTARTVYGWFEPPSRLFRAAEVRRNPAPPNALRPDELVVGGRIG